MDTKHRIFQKRMNSCFWLQLASLSAQISDQTLKLKLEIKSQSLFTMMSRIKRFMNQRLIIVGAYHPNVTSLIYYLDQMLLDFRTENLEYEMTHYIDFKFVGSDSLMTSFIQLVTSYKTSTMSPFIDSPNKMVYDFYITILNAVNECHAFLKLTYMLREEVTGGDKRFVEIDLINLNFPHARF